MKGTQMVLATPNPGDWCTLADVAAALGITRVQVWRIVHVQKRLRCFTIGEASQVLLVWRADLEEYAAARRKVRGE